MHTGIATMTLYLCFGLGTVASVDSWILGSGMANVPLGAKIVGWMSFVGVVLFTFGGFFLMIMALWKCAKEEETSHSSLEESPRFLLLCSGVGYLLGIFLVPLLDLL